MSYKIKHIPTGLFFQPDRGNGNLSKIGKIYQHKPNIQTKGLSSVSCIIIDYKTKKSKTEQLIFDHFKEQYESKKKNNTKYYFSVDLNDWQVIELRVEERIKDFKSMYEVLQGALPKEILDLYGKDKIITTALDYIKTNPILAIAYLFGVIHSTRELLTEDETTIKLLQQFETFGIGINPETFQSVLFKKM